MEFGRHYSTSMDYGHILLRPYVALLWSNNRINNTCEKQKPLGIPGGRAQHGLAQEQLVLGSEAQGFQHWQLNRNQNLTCNGCQLLTPNSCWVSSSKKEGPCLSGTSYSQLIWVTGSLLYSQQHVIFPPPSISNPRNVSKSKPLIIKTSPCLPETQEIKRAIQLLSSQIS